MVGGPQVVILRENVTTNISLDSRSRRVGNETVAHKSALVPLQAVPTFSIHDFYHVKNRHLFECFDYHLIGSLGNYIFDWIKYAAFILLFGGRVDA